MILYGRAFRKYGRGKGLDGREGVEVSRTKRSFGNLCRDTHAAIITRRGAARERGEYIKTRDEVSSYVTIMAGVGREQFHVRS